MRITVLGMSSAAIGVWIYDITRLILKKIALPSRYLSNGECVATGNDLE